MFLFTADAGNAGMRKLSESELNTVSGGAGILDPEVQDLEKLLPELTPAVSEIETIVPIATVIL